MITYKQVENKTMNEEKRKSAKVNIFAYYVGRPISYVFTIPFLYTKIKPNTITLVSMLFSVLGLVFTSLPNSKWFPLIGFVFFFLWNIFDGIDGNVARYKEEFSKNGSLFDATAGYLQAFVSFFAYGICSYNFNGVFSNYFGFDPVVFVVLGALSGFFMIFPRLVMHKKISSSPLPTDNSLKEKESFGLTKKIALNLTSASGFIQLFMLLISVLCIFNYYFFDFFTLIYFLINSIFMVLTLYKLLSR